MNSHKQRILDLIESMVANVQKNVDKINDLNVFPVPDGDTGSNMLATLVSAWNNISDESNTDVEIFRDFSRGALLGARGNSGVITSQIIKGLAVGIEEVGTLSHDVADLRKILRHSREYAYNAVANPVEGTILSAVRALDENYDREATSLEEAFSSLIEIAQAATDKTPEQLPILKEAGVVDSGAYGFVLMLQGALSALEGNPITIIAAGESTEEEKFSKADATKNIGYCTEFIVTLKDPENFPKEEFNEDLEKLGDSIVMIVEEDILKVHVHAKRPGQVFNLAQHYGEFGKIKAENMASQAEDAGHSVEGENFSINKEDANKLAIVAVSNGVGLDEEFKALGVDVVVSGGQSMNPSVEDFMKIIEKLPNKKIVLLPNNSNIILTADTVKQNVEGKDIYVLPTKSLQQGLVALYNMNKEMLDFENFQEGIIKEFQAINEGQITHAVRDTEMNGVKVTAGHFISLKGKEILASTPSIIETYKSLVDKIVEDGGELITIIYNDDVTTEEREEIVKYTESINDDIEVEVKYGGQGVYHLLVFGEE